MIHKLRKRIVSENYAATDILFKAIRFMLSRKKRSPQKIVVFSFKLLGDSVFTIPALRYFLSFYPGKEVVLFTYTDNKTIYDLAFSNVKFVTFKKSDFNLDSPSINFRLLKKVWEQDPDIIIDFTSGVFIALTLLLSRSRINIGFNLPIFRFVYDSFLSKRDKPHLMDMYLDPVKKHFKQEELSIDFSFPVSLKQNGIIAVCPFAGWKAKEWGIGKFIELSSILNTEFRIRFIVPSGSLSDNIAKVIINQQMEIATTKDIPDLIAELNKVSFILANDSGPVYIANLLGKPTFTIYGPTNPAYSLPFGKHHGYIQKLIKCSPENNKQYCYMNAGRSCKSFDCMNSLSVEEVNNALSDFMAKYKIVERDN